MSLENWPASLRISPDGFGRSPAFKIDVQEALDGHELRIDWGPARWRFDFTVKTVGDERVTLENFFVARRGKWEPFAFTVPKDKPDDPAVALTVRFDMDAIVGTKLGPSVYEYRVSLVQVVT